MRINIDDIIDWLFKPIDAYVAWRERKYPERKWVRVFAYFPILIRQPPWIDGGTRFVWWEYVYRFRGAQFEYKLPESIPYDIRAEFEPEFKEAGEREKSREW